jgi:hypothetical protein
MSNNFFIEGKCNKNVDCSNKVLNKFVKKMIKKYKK